MDWTHVLVAFAVALPATLTGIAAIVSAFRNGAKIDQVKTELDGRMTQLLKAEKAVAFEAGKRDAHENGGSPLAGPPMI